jgi:hypothetical protein
MKRVLLILFLLPLISDGQIINASGPYRTFAVVAPVSCAYPLDTYTGAASAYSLRLLKSDYAGSAIRVRRSSDDAEQNIGFVSGCELDTASMKSFVGANNGFIVKWYDQSGNARDFTQSTNASQPQIIISGVVVRQNAKPSVYFDGTMGMTRNATISITSHSVFAVFSYTSAVSYCRVFAFSVVGRNDYEDYVAIAEDASTSNFGTYDAGMVSDVAVTSGSLCIFTNINTGSATNNYVNGGSASNSSNSYSLTLARASLGMISNSGDSPAAALNGYISEIIFYTSDKSSSRTGIRDNANTYFSIY